MSLYQIIDREEQAYVRPAYRLKNHRERLARYSNHLTFLTRCRSEGIIPNRLRIVMPVRSKEADRIAARASQALLRELISDGHRQKSRISRQISRLESDLSQSLNADQWSRLNKYCQNAGHREHQAVKERQIRKFNSLNSQKTQNHLSQPTLDLETSWWST